MRRSTSDISWFWDTVLRDLGIEFYKPHEKVVDLSKGKATPQWCVGGEMNIVHNLLDKYAGTAIDKKIGITSETEDGKSRRLTYAELRAEVNKMAGALHSLGLGKDDAIGVFMPMTPEIVIAMLAIIKIGGVFLPLFSGFGEQAVASRLLDAAAKALFTSDGFYRRGEVVPMKATADGAAAQVPTLRHMLVLERTGTEVPWNSKRDHWWHELIPPQPAGAPTERTGAEAPLMIIYTSGTAGPPK